MDLAMDVYIPEDYVRRRRYRPNVSVQKRDDGVKAADEKKFQLPGDKNKMIAASTSYSLSSSFKEDILFSCFNP